MVWVICIDFALENHPLELSTVVGDKCSVLIFVSVLGYDHYRLKVVLACNCR
jgi:hypothetical protein